ncbi:MAG: hypothetical protein H6653_01905 [Ardenticatenaceae bacterium]|nr:hypothetical protein [Ardenticatenaceae bacterium]
MTTISAQHFDWELKGTVATGGTVLKVMGDAQEKLWVASPAGLFCGDGERWQAVRRGVPFWRLNTVCVNGRNLWAAGMPGGIIRSSNSGQSWSDCWIEQTEAPILAIAASPDYATDRVLLAATDGDGILRSTDGGRHWELSNFGLREFAVLDVLLAPKIGRYEHAFAISETGFYQSPNGGRAWQLVDLGDIEPAALAISPTFVEDRTVWLAMLDGALFKSEDAGQSFALVTDRFEAINALTFAPDGTLLIGTMTGIETVETSISNLQSPVLSLNVVNGAVYAGLLDGLSVSLDNGRSWQSVPALAARRLTWYLPQAAGTWLAVGPEEGVWQTADGGQSWQSIWEDLPVLAVAATPDTVWVSGVDGVAVSANQGNTWQIVWQPEVAVTALAVVNGRLWSGDASGQVWQQVDGTWVKTAVPFAGQQLVGFLTPKPDQLLAVSWSASSQMLQLWRLAEADAEWSLWFEQKAGAVLPHVALGEASSLVGLGSYVYHLAEGRIQREKVGSVAGPVTAVCALPGGGWLTAVTDKLLHSEDGKAWAALENELPGEAVVSLQVLGNQLMAGTTEGKIWITPLP